MVSAPLGTLGCVRGFDEECSGTGEAQETEAPIVYTSLQEWHLDQVHDLLTRIFWGGIDSKSFRNNPPLSVLIKRQ